MKCIVLGDLAMLFCSPLSSASFPLSSQVLCCYLILLGGEQSKRDPSVLAKKPCWLINKGGGWIRKLNHLWLLMSQPTDRHDKLPVLQCLAALLPLWGSATIGLLPCGMLYCSVCTVCTYCRWCITFLSLGWIYLFLRSVTMLQWLFIPDGD